MDYAKKERREAWLRHPVLGVALQTKVPISRTKTSN